MVDKELIENWRNMLKPSISSRLLKTNYEGRGEQDKEEFERDFDEILDLALIGLKYKAQLSQKRTEKRTETRACDLISRQAAIDEITEYGSGDTVYMSVVELKRRIEQLPPAQPEQRWIPCCERLPEERDWYLGIFKEPDTGWINPIPFICDYLLGTKTKATTKEGWILKGHTDREEYIDYYFNLECVAWMPLPEPYKVGETT